MCYNYNRLQFVSCLLVAVLISADVSSVSAETPPEMTYRNYPEWNVFPRGFCAEDRDDIQQYEHLVEQGESAYEAMLAVVKQCDDCFIGSTALAILRESKGEKRAVVEELKDCFSERLSRSGDENQEMLILIAEALADMGREDDMEVLIPMLSRPEWRVRVIGTRCLGKRGGLRALEALEQVQGRDSNKRVAEEIDKAIAAIETRLAAQDAEASPSP